MCEGADAGAPIITKTVAPAQDRPKRRCRESALAIGLPSVGECWVLRQRDDWQGWLDCGRRRVAQPRRDKAESDMTYPEVQGLDPPRNCAPADVHDGSARLIESTHHAFNHGLEEVAP